MLLGARELDGHSTCLLKVGKDLVLSLLVKHPIGRHIDAEIRELLKECSRLFVRSAESWDMSIRRR